MELDSSINPVFQAGIHLMGKVYHTHAVYYERVHAEHDTGTIQDAMCLWLLLDSWLGRHHPMDAIECKTHMNFTQQFSILEGNFGKMNLIYSSCMVY